MRSVGIFAVVVGCVCIGLGIALPVCRPLIRPGAIFFVSGLIPALVAGWFRAVPTVLAPDGPGGVRDLFLKAAEDRDFRKVAGLSDEEVKTLLKDLETASYRYSFIVQGGCAGRDDEGQLILALSPWHLRRIPAIHELLHLARDVIYRSRKAEGRPAAGKPLEATTGVVAEEILVWVQTLACGPLSGGAEAFVQLSLMILPVVGVYVFVPEFDWKPDGPSGSPPN